jgi:hypothetical protein
MEPNFGGICSMATLAEKRAAIQKLIENYAAEFQTDNDITQELIFDQERDRYLLLEVGWRGSERIHHCIFHLDIINGQIWVQVNQTDRLIAHELVEMGIDRQEIVLGLQRPQVRPFTEFAAG